MRSLNFVRVVVCLSAVTFACLPGQAQEAGQATAGGPGSTLAAITPSRVVERVDDTRLVKFPGNTHPLARAQYDQGLVDPQLAMERMELLLKRSPSQEAGLEKLMEQQTNPKSPNFHHWLTPEQFGKTYGPSDSDVAAVTSWLQNHGFQIYQVNTGRVTIEFSGTAAQVQEAFHVELHHYLVNGKMHVANDRDPQIPSALAPVVGGVASLHNFFPVHQSILGGYVRRNPKTGIVTPVDPLTSELRPEYGFTNQEGDPAEDITPYDFATIYNLLPLWNAGITGKGQTIAISAVTDIQASDVTTFRSTFGLGGFAGTIKQIVNGTDPGIDQGSLVENTLDTEWSGATAPDADVAVIISKSTTTTFGGQLSDSYIVNNPTVATIMSASYGECEIGLGTSGNQAINAIYQQGAAEGISIFESSGDQGSTGCDNSDATTFPAPAGYGLQVNGDASSPYVTAVGGTEFTWQNYRTQYWSATNSGTNYSNALGYIPESPWNGTCTSQVLLDRFWDPQYGFTTLEEVCNQVVTGSTVSAPDFTKVTGGSGGVSSCITSTNSEFSTCGGGYAQPSWQKGVTGMPGTTYRYLPDVSLFASSGFPYGLNGSAYLICVASNSTQKTCDYTDNTEVIYQEVGGTSVSSPALAGIMALVQQNQKGQAQGLANPYFYALAAKDNLTSCNSSTVAAGNSCNFYDVTYGNNEQVCTTGSRNCVTNTSGDKYGVVSGYLTTTGYDQATGLGSVNATNLVNNWATVTASPAITLTPTSLTFASTTVGSTTAAQSVTVKNTGTASATLTSETITGTNATSFLKSATNCGTTLAANATCTVSVEFKPAAAGSLTASLSVADSATGSPQTVALSGTGTAASLTLTLSPASVAFASTTVGSTTAAQVVTVKNTGTAAVTLTSETISGTNSTSFLKSATTCGTMLAAAASCTVSVEFKPAAAGSLTASLSVADNATGSPQTVTLTGTGAAAALTVTLSPTSLTFASTTVGSTTAAQLVTVKNTSTAAVTLTSETITGTNATSFLKSATTCGTTLAASATCTVSVEFKPAAAGSLTASLSVADNATGSPQTVKLTGTGAATQLTVTLSPKSLAFASTSVGSTTAAQVVTVKNTGTSPVTLTSETFTGTNPTSFLKSATTCGTTLAASASCTVSVEFKPVAAGSLAAYLSIADNATGSPQTATMTGTGVAAPLAVSLSPASLTFASTAVGSTTAAQLVTVKNTGTSTVSLTSETITGTSATSFLKSATTCGTTLAASATCTVSIEFKPAAAGTLTASLSVADNATGSPQTVSLTGTGTAANSPTITLSPASIAFPATITGTTSDAQLVTLTNTGTLAVTISSIAIAGTNATSFLDLSSCGATLASKASCSIYVAFEPASAAALSGTLSVTDTATGSPQKVTLTGTGTARPSVKLSAITLAFPTTAHGTTSATKSIVVTNGGTATLDITSITLGGTNPTDFEALNTCGPTLAAGATCTVYIAFKPATAAAFKATLSIVDNGSASPQSVALSGTGD